MNQKISLSSVETSYDREKVTRYTSVTILLFLSTLISYINWVIYPHIFINFLQIILFYTLLKYSKFLPWLSFFLCSIIQDFFLNLPFGMTIISSIILVFLLVPQKKILKKAPFYILWSGFGIFLALNTLFILASVAYLRSYSLHLDTLFSISLLSTWFLFPVVSFFLYRSYEMIKKLEEIYAK